MASLSAARQELAERIETLNDLRREMALLDAASGPAFQAEIEATTALDAARTAVEQATKADVTRRIAVLAGGGDEPEPEPVEAARARVRIAEDQLAAAQAARAEIERRSREAADWLPTRESIVRGEARRVMWSEVRTAIVALTKAADEAQRAWINRADALAFLMSLAPRPFPEQDQDLVAARRHARQLEIPPIGWLGVHEAADGTAERWRAAFAALQQDAATRLPK